MTHKLRKYSEAFRRQVVAEYEAGESILTLQRKYGIHGNNTIRQWIEKYGKEGLRHEVVHIQTAEEADRVKELEQQVQELQKALGKQSLEKMALESLLEEYQAAFGDLAKKNVPVSSNGPTPRPKSRGSQ